MYTTLPTNQTLLAIQYNSGSESLDVIFRKGQIRTYHGVPITTAYRLAYSKDPASAMQIYSTEIKKKFKVTVK